MEAFTEWKIVPEVIETVPLAVAEVAWSNGVKADMGKILTPTQVWHRNWSFMLNDMYATDKMNGKYESKIAT